MRFIKQIFLMNLYFYSHLWTYSLSNSLYQIYNKKTYLFLYKIDYNNELIKDLMIDQIINLIIYNK